MANSFALTDNGVVLQQPGQSVPVPQTTLSGGGAGQAALAPGGEFDLAGQRAADMSVRAMEALNTMTQGALAPYVQAQQQKAYFDGMSQVVQGKALQDIEREQPWYTKIFGPSATVQGAQAMAALTAVSQAQSEFMEALPELRKQSPDAARQYLTEQAMRVADTGDPLVNGIVQQKLVEQWSAMLSTHLKQHVAWRQEDAGEKFVALQTANGKLLQETLGQQGGFASPEQMQQEVAKFNEGLLRPVGMEDGAWGKYLTTAAQSQLHAGNFAAYEAMKANPDVWQTIPAEARQALEDSEPTWVGRALRDAPAMTDITGDLSKFQLAVKQGWFPGNEENLHEAIDQFNAQFRTESGSNADMINNVERANLVEQYHRAQAAAAASFEAAQQGRLNDQAQWANVIDAINGGSSALLAPGVSEAIAREAVESFWAHALQSEGGLDNGLSKLALVSDKQALRPSSLEVQLRQDAHALFQVGGSLTERQQGSLAIMQKLLTVTGGGPGALANYIGADNAARVQAFLNSGVDLNDAKSLTEMRKLFKDGGRAVVTSEDKQAAKDYIRSQAPGWFKRIFGKGELSALELNDATKARLVEDLTPLVATHRKALPGLDDEAAAKYAFDKLYGNQNNVDFVDGTLVPKNPYLPGTQSLYSAIQQMAGFPISQTSETYQQGVKAALREVLKENVERQVQGVEGATMKHFRPDDYEAVGGEQLQGGALMMTYNNVETNRPVHVLVTPERVFEGIKEALRIERVRINKNEEAAAAFARDAAAGKPATFFLRKPFKQEK